MARGKKNGGRGDGDRAKRGAHGGRGGGRHSHNRPTRGRGSGKGQAPANNAPSAAFLAALEAQRAKQADEEAVQQHSSRDVEEINAATVIAAEGSALETSRANVQQPKRPALPGFLFDEECGRYFKFTKQDEQQQKKKRRAEAIAQAQAEERKARFESRAAMTGRLAVRRAGWLGRLAQREISNAPVIGDRSGLLSRYYGARLSNHELRSVDVALDSVRDRFTAMDINADASSIYVGFASGHIRSYVVNEPSAFHQRRVVEEDLSLRIDASTVSAIRYHPKLPGVVLFSAIGAGVAQPLTTLLPRGGNEEMSGQVRLLSNAIFSRQPLLWRFPDPWTTEWSPVGDATFSVGLHGDVGAAIVDGNFVGAAGRGVTVAPTGRIQSDTLSQAFYPHTSSVIVNGSRDGSWWLWDTRSPRRSTEFIVGKNTKNVGALQCLRVLNDERRLLQQRSNGELSVVDLRSPSHSLVTKLSSGVKHVYRSMLRFDVDENEAVVVAAMGASIDVFDLHAGNELARMSVSEKTEPNASVPEQVFYRDTNNSPTVWSLSRSVLYRSHSP